MRNSNLVLSTIVFSTIAACSLQDHAHDSGLKQLVEDDFPCAADVARLAPLQERYPSTLQGGSAQHRNDAWDALSLIPNEYLHWVLDRNLVPIELRNVGGSVRGVTTSTGNGQEWWPSHIWVAPKTGNFNALLHEMGHATEHYLKQTFPNFTSDLNAVFSEVQRNGEASVMRGYARSNPTEFFAEIFDSYYCSDAARDDMANRMPTTLAFAQKYLVSHEELDHGNSGDHTGAGRDLGVDNDRDGVSNHYDRCADTPAGETVLVSREHYGCSMTQIESGDADGDGIADAVDRCPNTPSGATVWRDTTGPNARWLGCAGGQTPGQ